MKQKMITITVPCYNEEKNVKPMAETLVKIMESMDYRFEIIFTDNCSTDATREEIRKVAAEDKRIKAIFNNRNYGVIDGRSSYNMCHYISREADAMIHIPCDFQEPPELIPEFIKYWEEGYKVVCGQKTASKEGKGKYFLRQVFYKIIKKLSDVPQYDNLSGIHLSDREVIEQFLKIDEDIEFRWAIADMGYEVKMIQYTQEKRKSGKSSYNLWRYLSFAISSLIATSTAPLRLMTVAGAIMSMISFVIGVAYLIFKLVLWNWFQAGVAPVLIAVLFLGSVQLLFLGMIGEYVATILRKVTKRPDVIVKESINMEPENYREWK